MRLQYVPEEKWVRGDYRPVAIINTTAGDVSSRFGVRFDVVEECGLGMIRLAMLQADGTQFMLQEHMQASPPYNAQITINCLYGPAMAADLRKVCAVFGWKIEDMTWVHSEIVPVRPVFIPKKPQP